MIHELNLLNDDTALSLSDGWWLAATVIQQAAHGEGEYDDSSNKLILKKFLNRCAESSWWLLIEEGSYVSDLFKYCISKFPTVGRH